MKYVLGIDIGGTTVKLGLFNHKLAEGMDLELMAKTQIPTRTEDSGEHILEDVAKACEALCKENDVAMKDVLGAGIGVPGPVIVQTEDESYLVNKCVNLGWGQKDVSAEFRALAGIPLVKATNDANAAAVGEAFYGMEKLWDGSRRCSVMVTLGTGVGGGIIVHGRLVHGTFGAAGELGHMLIAPMHPLIHEVHEEDLAPFGELEYYASATGIARTANAYLKAVDTPSTLRDLEELTTKDVFDAAKAGDQVAQYVTEFFFDTIATALGTISAVVDPESYIIGGGVSHAGKYLLDGIENTYRQKVFHASRGTNFRLAGLGNDAGIYGAAGLVLMD